MVEALPGSAGAGTDPGARELRELRELLDRL